MRNALFNCCAGNSDDMKPVASLLSRFHLSKCQRQPRSSKTDPQLGTVQHCLGCRTFHLETVSQESCISPAAAHLSIMVMERCAADVDVVATSPPPAALTHTLELLKQVRMILTRIANVTH